MGETGTDAFYDTMVLDIKIVLQPVTRMPVLQISANSYIIKLIS